MPIALQPLTTAPDPGPAMPVPMALALSGSFASVAAWRAEFVATLERHASATGHVELAFDPDTGILLHRYTPLEAMATPAHDANVLLAVPMPADPALAMGRIDWADVYRRYTEAVHAASGDLEAQHADVGCGETLVDVRRAGVFEAAPTRLANAVWHDPSAVAAWAQRLPAGHDVIVYCVFGHEVGRVTAMRLRAQGVRARFLAGGIDDWERAGLPTVAKESGGAA